jgi:hypothetical protein
VVGLEFGQEAVAVGEDGAEDAAAGRQQVGHVGGAQGVHDLAAVAVGDDHARAAEDSQLLGEVGGLDVDRGQQVADRTRTGLEQFEGADADRVTQDAEHLGLGLIERHRHERLPPSFS